MTLLWLGLAGLAVVLVVLALRRLTLRNAGLWVPAYVKRDWAGRRERRLAPADGPVHVMFCVADHFEPGRRKPGLAEERRRVRHWLEHYPPIADSFRDADGRPPRHTFFYPAEEYRPEHLDRLAELARSGYGEVEVHLHHDADTSEALRHKLLTFAEQLRSHGHLGSDRTDGKPRFAFIHGNWALDNSRPDGRWCGVNDELRVLRDCGCYADFTLPSAPSPTQTRRINSIYYATDDPDQPKSHDDGKQVAVGGTATGDLMIIQGPLTVIWGDTKPALRPRLETGNLAGAIPLTTRRADAWVHTHISVSGKPDWVFVKVHTHGCHQINWDVLLGPPIARLHRHLAERYNDGRRYQLHYVTAREMYNIIKAAERGLQGNPGQYRDLDITPPPLIAAAAQDARVESETAP